MNKSRDAFRTISEVSEWLDTPAHVLRFWESKFTQIKPVKRAGGRRYYRPDDMELLSGIKTLLHEQGMTIKGVQKLLREQGVRHVMELGPALAEPDEAQVDGIATEVLAEPDPVSEPIEPPVMAPAPPAIKMPPAASVVTLRPVHDQPADIFAFLAKVPADPGDDDYNPRSRFQAAFVQAKPELLAKQVARLAPLYGRLQMVRDRLAQD